MVQDFVDWQHGPDMEVWTHDHAAQQAGSDGALHKVACVKRANLLCVMAARCRLAKAKLAQAVTSGVIVLGALLQLRSELTSHTATLLLSNRHLFNGVKASLLRTSAAQACSLHTSDYTLQ